MSNEIDELEASELEVFDADDPFAYGGRRYSKNLDLATAGTIFDIVGIDVCEKVFEGLSLKQWEVCITIASGGAIDEQWISLSCNEARDPGMERAVQMLADGKVLRGYQLVKSGRAYYFRKVRAVAA